MASDLPMECNCRPDPGVLPTPFLLEVLRDSAVPALLGVMVDYEDGRWRAKELARPVVDWTPEYALRYSERMAIPAGRLGEVMTTALEHAFGGRADDGVAGEILLHAISRSFYGSDTVINKAWFKAAGREDYKGFDSVHVVHGDDGLELWLGESKFYLSAPGAIAAAVKSVSEHLARDYLRGEFAMIAPKIDDSHPHAEELRALIHRNTSLDRVFKRICVPIFIAYESSAAGAATATSEQLIDALKLEFNTYRKSLGDKFDPVEPVRLMLFLLPLSSKSDVMSALEERIKHGS